MLWILLGIVALGLLYWLLVRPYNYWIDRNVLQGKPVPILGHQSSMIFRKRNIAEFVQYFYGMFPNSRRVLSKENPFECDLTILNYLTCNMKLTRSILIIRYFGVYQFYVPTLVLRDPDLIKQICVKDFDYFMNHRSTISEDIEPLLGKNLFSLRGERWRHMRATLSPSFTSSKMKIMFVLISECVENFVKHFQSQVTDTLTIDVKDVFTRFTNDVIATTAFGVNCNSLENRNNEFYLKGKRATDFSGFWKGIKFMLAVILPGLLKLLKIKLFDKDLAIFFQNLISETMRTREEKNIVRPDMLNLLMEARKGKLKHEEASLPETGFATVEEHSKATDQNRTELTDTDITAQALIFFLAGFDSVASLMTFTSYELAVNPDIQEKLQREIDETYDACNGKITYEALMKMKYLDMVLSESLRKWPNLVSVDRVCVKPYTIEPKTSEEKPVKLEIGDMLWVPILGLHYDEKYYPNPNRFDPERFNDENKSKINRYTYIPFGVGPRNCIASRFALLETKLLYFYILRNFDVVPVEKTQIPLKLMKHQFNLVAEKGIWLGFKKRVF